MKRQALLGIWILIGAALLIGALVVRDSSTTASTDASGSDSDLALTDDADSSNTDSSNADSSNTDSSNAESSDGEATTSTVPPTTEAPTTTATPTTTTAPDQQGLPADAASLADALTEAELMVRSSDDPAPWGRRQQQLYRLLTTNREWAPEVIAAVDDEIRPAVGANWDARLNLSALVSSGPLSTVLPAWRIREPLPADELVAMYQAAEAETSIPWEYLAAINLVETRMGRIEGLSTAGATGPMQFLPSTFAQCCDGDPTDDSDAIMGAAVYLTLRGGPTDMAAALRGYNNSARYVNAVTAYAQVLEADPTAYAGYHAWDVFFLSASGLIRMPVGYNEPEPVAADDWVAKNPDAVID